MVVRVSDGEQIPADLLLLATSNEANSCYIDTASIDGETSLKIRRAPLFERDALRLWAVSAPIGTMDCVKSDCTVCVGPIERVSPRECLDLFFLLLKNPTDLHLFSL